MPVKTGIQEFIDWFPAFAGKTTEDEMISVENTIMRPLIIVIPNPDMSG